MVHLMNEMFNLMNNDDRVSFFYALFDAELAFPVSQKRVNNKV